MITMHKDNHALNQVRTLAFTKAMEAEEAQDPEALAVWGAMWLLTLVAVEEDPQAREGMLTQAMDGLHGDLEEILVAMHG